MASEESRVIATGVRIRWFRQLAGFHQAEDIVVATCDLAKD